MTISITRALVELKLTEKKIADKTAKLHLAAKTSSDDSDVMKESFKKQANTDLQQVRDLIKRRYDLKNAIVASNAATKVTLVNKDKKTEMTVAAAIEYKTSIEFEVDLLRRMREQYSNVRFNVEQTNEGVKAQADRRAESMLKADTVRQKSDEYKSLVQAYINEHKVELIHATDIEQLIEKMQDEIDFFKSEIDFLLQESNTSTYIEV